MKTLYVAAGFDGSTTLDRKRGLVAAGWEIEHLDSDPWVNHPFRKWKGLHDRSSFGPLIWSFNRRILSVARAVRPDVVWVDKGIWVKVSTILKLQEMGAVVAHFTPDSAIQFNRTRCFMHCIPHYDVLFTTKAWEMDDYRRVGVKRLELAYQGTDVTRTRPMELSNEEQEVYGCDLVFAGRGEEHYAKTLVALLAQMPSLKLKIWGAWQVAVQRHPALKPYWQGGNAMGDAYARALSGAKIGLGLLSKLFPETETTRTFEIPACRTMLLAERTDSHLRFFKEGSEAEFFSTVDEAAEKISYYLSNHDARTRIASAGYNRFLSEDYTVDRFMGDCARSVERVVAERCAS